MVKFLARLRDWLTSQRDILQSQHDILMRAEWSRRGVFRTYRRSHATPLRQYRNERTRRA